MNTEEYLELMNARTMEAYEIAQKARQEGLDLEDEVDIKIAQDVAARVEGLVSTVVPELLDSGLKEKIRELETVHGKGDELIGFEVAEKVAKQEFCKFESTEKALEAGVRVAVAYFTEGVVTAPLEGVVEVKIKKNPDGTDYASIFYAGPIRSAGGTAEALSILITDHLRKVLGVGEFKANNDEMERYVIELDDYHKYVSNLQYKPSDEEIRFMASHLPVELNGDPTTQMDVSNYRDLPRVGTSKIRGGMCLVFGEGISQKAEKIIKRLEKLKIEGWDWLKEYSKIKEKANTKKVEGGKDEKVAPSYKYIKEIVGGRPVFAYPSVPGGFRLRYGRSRASGFAGYSLHPATMVLTDDFIAIGTQLRVERPGKATVISACDYIEGPVVKLKNGDVLQIETEEQARIIRNKVDSILFMGDILIAYGDFLHNNHILMPSGYCEEWWVEEMRLAIEKELPGEKEKTIQNFLKLTEEEYENFIKKPLEVKPSLEKAIELSKKLNIPLHPKYNFFWNQIIPKDLAFLQEEVNKEKIEKTPEMCEVLEKLRVPFKVDGIYLDLGENFLLLKKLLPLSKKVSPADDKSIIEIIESISGIRLREKALTFIGARMGRPEKSNYRMMNGKPQGLFPVGEDGGRFRSMMENNRMKVDLPNFFCKNCNEKTFFRKCPTCGTPTEKMNFCTVCGQLTAEKKHCRADTKVIEKQMIPMEKLLIAAQRNLGEHSLPELIKGVRGMTSKSKMPERIEKAILRAKHNLYTFKDGTIRFDATDMPLTHFKPYEIGVSLKKLIEMGYTEDYLGKKLEKDDQILELKVQDVVLPSNSIEYLIRATKFIDELLEKFYKLPPFYKVTNRDDLVGQMIIGLAPHTSAGIVGRIVGFTDTLTQFAHPYWHSSKRRNCDGDEDSILFLMDAFLNFSRQYLPDVRGGRSMDCVLVLTTKLNPEEIDDEVWDMDVTSRYPLGFYEATLRYDNPKDVKIETVSKRMKTNPYTGLMFTHDSSNFTAGPKISAYKSLKTMLDKTNAQLHLAEKIQAVNAQAVAELVLDKHFLKDIRGNLRTFTNQQFRCTKCNKKYRRPPLIGKCVCGGNLTLTVHKGTVEKYIEASMAIAEKYHLPVYEKQCLHLLQRQVETTFGRPHKQTGLDTFFEVSP